jgi:hypothetical protein
MMFHLGMLSICILAACTPRLEHFAEQEAVKVAEEVVEDMEEELEEELEI